MYLHVVDMYNDYIQYHDYIIYIIYTVIHVYIVYIHICSILHTYLIIYII